MDFCQNVPSISVSVCIQLLFFLLLLNTPHICLKLLYHHVLSSLDCSSPDLICAFPPFVLFSFEKAAGKQEDIKLLINASCWYPEVIFHFEDYRATD